MYSHKNGLVLRKVEEHDLQDLKALKQESWYATHTTVFLNDQDQQDWFFRNIKDHRSLTLISEFENEAIGTYKIANIDPISHTAQIGYDIYKSFRGQGLGYKIVEAGTAFAFEILNIHRCEAEVLSNNIASSKVIEAAGFVLEGIKRKSIFKCGEYLDSKIYGILKEDWYVKNPVVANISYTPKDGKNWKS